MIDALPRPRPRLDNATVGMALLLVTELMFFCGLISAYLVARASTTGSWPPPEQPRLPVAGTAANTAVLILSAATLALARSRRGVAATAGLGALFLALQGREWVRLLGFGLTTTSSLYGAFFYTLIGAHGIHVLAGLAILAWVVWGSPRGRIPTAAALYWYFVVGLWPVLYALVYCA